MRSYGRTDIGLRRSVNQDYVYYSDEAVGNLPNLFVVADGMGGHKAGDFASKFCVESFIDCALNSTNTNPIAIMKEALHKVNGELIEKAKSKEEYNGMGTTFVGAVINNNKLYVANVGDSRLYYVTDEEIKQITLDHSLVEELIRTGQLERQKVRNHPEKNIITRAIGANDEVIVDFFEVTLNEGDKIVMCSDGLSNMVEDDEIRDIVKFNDVEKAVNELIDRANYYGGNDNIAVVVVDYI